MRALLIYFLSSPPPSNLYFRVKNIVRFHVYVQIIRKSNFRRKIAGKLKRRACQYRSLGWSAYSLTTPLFLLKKEQ